MHSCISSYFIRLSFLCGKHRSLKATKSCPLYSQCVCSVLSRSCTVGFQLLLVENDEDREQSVLDVILVFLSFPPPSQWSQARLRKRASPGCSAVSEHLSLIGRAEHHQLINSIKWTRQNQNTKTVGSIRWYHSDTTRWEKSHETASARHTSTSSFQRESTASFTTQISQSVCELSACA